MKRVETWLLHSVVDSPFSKWWAKLLNIVFVYAIDLLWHKKIIQLFTKLNPPKPSPPNPFELLFKPELPPFLWDIFTSCVWAPMWEELAWRVIPIGIAMRLGEKLGDKNMLLIFIVPLASIHFGFMHGGALNILLQGAGGLLYAYLYLKNGRSYWSAVAAHALWNFIITITIHEII